MQVTLIISATKPIRWRKKDLAENGDMVALLDNIAANVRPLLNAKGWKDQEFAKKVGVTPQVMSRWLNKKAPPELKHVDKMAEVLGVPVDELTRPAGSAVIPLIGRDIDTIIRELAAIRRDGVTPKSN